MERIMKMSKKREALSLYLSALVNLIASLAMLILLRGGTPVGGDGPTRLLFIHHNTVQWVAGWCIWIAAAVFLLLFFAILQENLAEDFRENPEKAPPPWGMTLALMVAAAGICSDTVSEALSSTAIVTLAHQFASASPVDQAHLLQLYALLDRISVALTGFLGNGLYCIAGLLLNIYCFYSPRFPRWLAWLGLLGWFWGFLLSVATLMDWPLGMMVTTAIVMPLFIGWCAATGYFYVAKKDQADGMDSTAR